MNLSINYERVIDPRASLHLPNPAKNCIQIINSSRITSDRHDVARKLVSPKLVSPSQDLPRQPHLPFPSILSTSSHHTHLRNLQFPPSTPAPQSNPFHQTNITTHNGARNRNRLPNPQTRRRTRRLEPHSPDLDRINKNHNPAIRLPTSALGPDARK